MRVGQADGAGDFGRFRQSDLHLSSIPFSPRFLASGSGLMDVLCRRLMGFVRRAGRGIGDHPVAVIVEKLCQRLVMMSTAA